LGLQSLRENLKQAQFCSARLSSGHWGCGDTKNARLKGGRYKTVPILSSQTNSSAPTFGINLFWALAPEASGPEGPSERFAERPT
jgi:hypothetical protein